MKKISSLCLSVILISLILISGCGTGQLPSQSTDSTPSTLASLTQPPVLPAATNSPIPFTLTATPTGISINVTLQSGNTLPKYEYHYLPSHLHPFDIRLGWGLGGIWNEIDNLPAQLDGFIDFGINRLETSIHQGEPPIDWDKPETEIPPQFDQFIDGLNDSGIAVNYAIHFWDIEGHARGEVLETPRFKTQEQIDDFLNFVRFLVDHFKGRVQYYTIWTEPDYCGGGQIKCIRTNDYIELARQTIPVIQDIDPQAKVVMAPRVIYWDMESLLTVLRSEVGSMFDVISWHGIYNQVPNNNFGGDYSYGDYYYEYPSVIEEIKQTAFTNGFAGEFWSTDITICSQEYPTCWSGQEWELVKTDKIAAKYDARFFIIHLGMDVGVSWGGLEHFTAPWTYPTVQRLNTVMAGGMPVPHSVEFEND